MAKRDGPKRSHHEKGGSKKQAMRATREAGLPKKIKKPNQFGHKDKPKPKGRPKGSTLDPVWRLTPNQMQLAEDMLEAEAEQGFFPMSIHELARSIGHDRNYVRTMLRREDFQKYLNHLLSENGIVLEMQFWRGMAIGLQIGDPRILTLYARMTGKIAKEEKSKLTVEIVAPDGSKLALPEYTKDEPIDVEVIEEETGDG